MGALRRLLCNYVAPAVIALLLVRRAVRDAGIAFDDGFGPPASPASRAARSARAAALSSSSSSSFSSSSSSSSSSIRGGPTRAPYAFPEPTPTLLPDEMYSHVGAGVGARSSEEDPEMAYIAGTPPRPRPGTKKYAAWLHERQMETRKEWGMPWPLPSATPVPGPRQFRPMMSRCTYGPIRFNHNMSICLFRHVKMHVGMPLGILTHTMGYFRGWVRFNESGVAAQRIPVVGPVVVKPDMDENAKKGVEERRTVAAIFDRRGKPGAYAAMLYGDGDDCRGFYPRRTFVFFVCDKTMPPGTLRFLNEMEPETCQYVTELASREWCDVEGKNWQDID